MNRIDALFQNARATGRKAFVPFLTAGDPDLPTTIALARSIMATAEKHDVPLLLEIGFPYSDPIADGATIQASYTRALAKKIRIADIFRSVADLRKSTETPLVAMVSFSLIYRNGVEKFLDDAQQAGFDGAIVPDLPVEEAEAVLKFGRERDFKIIELVAPTTPDERAAQIARTSTGFLYFVSVTGITGERDKLPEELPRRVERMRRLTDLPLCIGFGIGKPEHVRLVGEMADGVIVGSAIVRKLADLKPGDASGIAKLTAFVEELIVPLSGQTAAVKSS